MSPLLHSPLQLRSVTLRNRVVISPMCQYSAQNGYANDWHLVQLGRYALGGAGLIFTEATAVEERGRITHGDLGLWTDEQIPGLRRITDFLRTQGAAPAIQLSHAGRKGSAQRPWHGASQLSAADLAERDEARWDTVAPSAVPPTHEWIPPHALEQDELVELKQAWRSAARRSREAGFEVLEIHAAHGYLLHQFLSPLSNTRNDRYGGSREGRCRYPLEIVEAVRAEWPEDKPLFMRISAVDGAEDGWQLEDSLALCDELKTRGVDVVDCSSGGLARPAVAAPTVRQEYGFQVPFAAAIRNACRLPTMAVGLILDPEHAESVLQENRADLIAIAREALNNPNWALHAEQALDDNAGFSNWPEQIGWWLANRSRRLQALANETHESKINT
ncbi:2,4-dienoyl-CoA reductase [Modicisalibacter muralis]|uniref:2,4-dienoyl-CoA reductase n=1 Tax=Modicisalibacter muralis TaxID=119000 RepID=A0A1G9LN34_9GAMM|nr:NADH:flavin oxidoreductase/NADH oxidase [Halomonas muralis]SDL63197.1 2,4-dienoyl-CoA reductase [Halomonas muralis]